MTFEPLSDRFIHKLEHSSGLSNASAQPGSSPNSTLAGCFLSDIPTKLLTWLWPGRIPFGHLTLLDAAPGCRLSLFALTLATCVSSGSPLPDGTPTRQGNVILYTPYDSAADTIKPRLQAAGGDPAHVLLFHPNVENTSRKTHRSFALPHDLDHLATAICRLDARLVILDPASAIPGLSRCLPALIELAQQDNCAILLTRSLRQPSADPLHTPDPSSPLLEAARSRLLLILDPADERHHLLLTTQHTLCVQPPILAYDIIASEAGIPTIHLLGERDSSYLARLCTGPLHSTQRQTILRFLQNSSAPRSIPEILAAACYDYTAGRKMLLRMKEAGELISLARGLYTTPNHPCLARSTDDPPVPNVPTVPNIPSLFPQSPTNGNSPLYDVPSAADVLITDLITGKIPTDSSVSIVPNPTQRTMEGEAQGFQKLP